MDFAEKAGLVLVDGHDHDEAELRAALAVAVGDGRAAAADLVETWYSDEGGFGHDCAAHQDVDKSLWSSNCGTFRSVTVATGISAPAMVARAAKVETAVTTSTVEAP